jgi:hypothetical protein
MTRRVLAGVSGVLATAVVLGAAPVLADPGSASPSPSSSPAGSDDGGVSERDRVDVAPSGHAFKQLTIDNPLGDVRVEGYDGTSIRIETRKHAPDDDALDRLRVSLIPPDADGNVRITTTADPGGPEGKPVRRGNVRIDIVIRAPRDARVDATVGAGHLDIEGMEAGGELDTASGPITVHHVSGNLYTHSVSGDTTLSEVFGSIDAQSLASDVQLDSITGSKLVASVDRGKIDGRRVRSREIELTTTEGPIVLEAEASLRGVIRVATLHGDIDVRLHRGDRTRNAIVVRATGLKVDLGAQAQAQERGDGWRQATFGIASNDAASIEMRSRYGNVVFAIIE